MTESDFLTQLRRHVILNWNGIYFPEQLGYIFPIGVANDRGDLLTYYASLGTFNKIQDIFDLEETLEEISAPGKEWA